MANKGAVQPKAPVSCRKCKRWNDVKERVRLMEVLESAIDKMQQTLKGEGFKPTIADYLKLVQIEKELDQAANEAKEIRVTWVEPTDSQSEQ
jgi:hypothetical protein